MLKQRLTEQKRELRKILNQIEDKIQKDVANYGKPLGNKVLTDKAESKKKAIKKTQNEIKKLEGKITDFGLSAHESNVLDAIRNNKDVRNTSTDERTWRVDNRFSGSISSRKQAKRYR